MRRTPITLALLAILLLGIGTVAFEHFRQSRIEADFRALNASLNASLEKGHVSGYAYARRLPPSPDLAMLKWFDSPSFKKLPEPFRSFIYAACNGPVDYLEITSFGPLKSEFPAALARFPRLDQLDFRSDVGAPSKLNDVERVCSAVCALPRLKHLLLEYNILTDESLAPLRGHPTLEGLELYPRDNLTPRCLETLRTLPALKTLFIGSFTRSRSRMPPSDRKAITDALPKVKVTFKD